ncbi:hypothetical protein J3458_008697 [Metarhizium acridum]|uniref:uncharacterized protein n=1 Tax=Metarhizium acridum TaxID=92637 RepID=UPI001C6BAA9F|nr:hypothetical protein J3458_008697 [Metarhizium acridum]
MTAPRHWINIVSLPPRWPGFPICSTSSEHFAKYTSELRGGTSLLQQQAPKASNPGVVCCQWRNDEWPAASAASKAPQAQQGLGPYISATYLSTLGTRQPGQRLLKHGHLQQK